jgi:hypothetical protein
MHGRDEKCIQNFGRKSLKVRDHVGKLGINGRIMLDLVLRK